MMMMTASIRVAGARAVCVAPHNVAIAIRLGSSVSRTASFLCCGATTSAASTPPPCSSLGAGRFRFGLDDLVPLSGDPGYCLVVVLVVRGVFESCHLFFVCFLRLFHFRFVHFLILSTKFVPHRSQPLRNLAEFRVCDGRSLLLHEKKIRTRRPFGHLRSILAIQKAFFRLQKLGFPHGSTALAKVSFALGSFHKL